MKKSIIILSIAAALGLAGCGETSSNIDYTSKQSSADPTTEKEDDKTSEAITQDTSKEDESSIEVKDIEVDYDKADLKIALYNNDAQFSADDMDNFKLGFYSWLAEVNYPEFTVGYWESPTAGQKVGDYCASLAGFIDEGNAKPDIILGMKANLVAPIYSTDESYYNVWKIDGTTIEIDLGTKQDRRVYMLKEGIAEESEILLEYLVTLATNYTPKEDDTSEDSSIPEESTTVEESSIPEESSAPEESSIPEESSSKEEVTSEEESSSVVESSESSEISVAGELTEVDFEKADLKIALYNSDSNFAAADRAAFKTNFIDWFETANYPDLTVGYWEDEEDNKKVGDYCADLAKYIETEGNSAPDVILGMKANLTEPIYGSDTSYYGIWKINDKNVEIDLGTKKDRRVYFLKEGIAKESKILFEYLETLIPNA